MGTENLQPTTGSEPVPQAQAMGTENHPEGEARREGGRNRVRNDRPRGDRNRQVDQSQQDVQGRQEDGNRNGGEGQERQRDNQKGSQREKGRASRSERAQEWQGAKNRVAAGRGAERGQVQERGNDRRSPEPARIVKKREETLEDIRAETERVEKDIQFEIKQIQTITLGL